MKKLISIFGLILLINLVAAQVSKKGNLADLGIFDKCLKTTNEKPKFIKRTRTVAQQSKTVNVATAGTLNNLLTSDEKSTISNLTITGNIDARDFRIMRDSMANLKALDISAVTIVSYTGYDGTGYSGSTYPANEIPENAFYASGFGPGNLNYGLASIVLPTSLTSIGRMAFTFCSSLTSVSISASVTQIGLVAFVGCSATINVDQANPDYSSVEGVLFDKAMTTLIQCPLSITGNYDLPSTVDSIAVYGFCFCDKLSSINIPSSVVSIGIYAFTSCSGIINVAANNPNYTSQEGVLFNKSLKTLIQCPTSKSGSYIIPSLVDTLGENSFYNCSLMTAVTMPSSVSYISDLSFYNCSGLTSITVNSLPVSLGSTYNVFYNVNQSTCILNVPYGTKPLYQSASGWSSFSNIVENTHGFILETNKLILSSFAGSNAKMKISSNDPWAVSSNQSWLKVIPENGSGSDTISVTAEANSSTDNRTGIVTVSADGSQSQTIEVTQSGIPRTLNITAGGLSASMTATELSSVINLKLSGTIDARDFKTMRDRMPKLTFLDLSEVSIAAYNGSEGTASWITVYPANKIPEYAFSQGNIHQNYSLATVKLPSTITVIGDYAFYLSGALTDIVIPNTVTNIGNTAFGYCNALVNVTLPTNLSSIGNSTFMGCGFSGILIPNSVKTIGTNGFGSCKNLKSVDIPNSVTSISNSAFENCITLTELTIGNSVKTIDNSAFRACTSLANVFIPNSVTTLSGFAFATCSNLKTVHLSDSLVSIGYYCFYQCPKLTDIIIPSSVTTIGYWAFNSCTGLKSITVNSDIPLDVSSSGSVFTGVDMTICILNVPFGAKSAYASANQWKDFSNIVENSQGFALDLYSVKLSYTEGSISKVKVSSNNQWMVSSDQSWLKVSPTTGTGNDSITLSADVNSSILSRRATVTVTATGVNSKTINVEQLAAPKIINLTAGGLAAALTSAELSTISNMILTGTIDARDFKTMRDNMPQLAYLDISAVNIVAYTGNSGTIGTYTNTYLANEIPQRAFSTTYAGKLSLISVLLPTSVISIGNFAFQFCSGLTTLAIPETVTAIGYYAFESCSSLNDITMPASLIKIESYTFSKCSKLKTIKIPELVTTISFDAFESCTALTNVTILNSVTYIDMNAFQNCSSLKEIIIPNSVITLGSDVFANCSQLTNVTLSNSMPVIASSTFSNCTELVTINIPNAVKIIDRGAFRGCTKLETVNFGIAVQKLNYGVFQSCTSLKQITIPNTVTFIDNSVFMNCTTLTDITIPNSVTSIGSDAFNGCKALKEISIPNSISKLSLQTFANCSGLKKVTLGDSLTSIESSAFYYCISLDSITLPGSLTTIGSSAFENCRGLKKVSFGNSLNSIGSGGFMSCFALNNITLPFSLKSIGSEAFESCSSLTEIILPNAVSTLGEAAFRSCENLVKVVNSNSVVHIPSMTFSGCTKLANISIGSSVVSIGELAFDYCVSLDNLTLSASLQIINGYAFRYCSSLDTISIPGSVTSIGTSAFESCTNLKAIYVNRMIPVDISNNMNVFNEVDRTNCILHVPHQTKSLYATANQWKEFVNIVENPYGLVLDTDSLNLSVNAGSSAKVNIISNTSWTASSDQSWLIVTPNSGSGTDSVILTAEANSLLSTRTAILTVQASGIETQYVTITQDAATKTVAVTAGGLNSALTHDEHTVLNRLTITGTLDARDFKFMRDSIPNLTYLDISQTTINAYTGSNGTVGSYTINYPAATIPQNAFDNGYYSSKIALKSIILPNSISSIGTYAFQYCFKLDSIAIPNSVTSIGDFAFDYCNNLKSVKLSNSLTTIGRVFSNCSSLTKIVIPNSVTSLTGSTFSYCSRLKDVSFSNSLTSIGSNAFNNCTGITDISIPNSVTLIDSYAFMNCTGLTNLIIGSKVNTIGMSAFSNCSSLAGLVLPKSLQTIGDYAFQACNLLPVVTIPENVGSIGSYAFSCSGLKSILSANPTPLVMSTYGVFSAVNKSTCTLYVPTGSKSLYQNTAQWKDFSNISEEFGFMLSNDTVRILSGESITINIPTTKTFTAVSDQPWLKTSTVAGINNTQIVLAGDVNPDLFLRTALVKFSFENGPSQIITVIQSGTPKTVTVSSGGLQTSLTKQELLTVSNLILTGTIDARDFRVMRDSMPQLADIDMKDVSITAYSGSEGTNSSISSYPANATPINAFYKTYSGVGKTTLASVILPTNITSIGQSSFAYAIGLSSIVIPDQVTLIGMTAFAYCGLKELTIGSSVTNIGFEAFLACNKLAGVAIPNAVKTIEAEAFSSCRDLKWVTFPDGLTTINSKAFMFCISLDSVNLPNTITTFGPDIFGFCYALKKANIPNTISELKSGTFYSCTSLKEISIPASVTKIGNRALGKCTVFTTINIPATVTGIEYGAFEFCTGLTSVYAYQITPIDLSASYYATVFNNVNKTNCKLYVPIGTKALYAAAVEWKDFTNIIEMTTAVPTLSESNIKIYPNPATDKFSISGLDETAQLTITDLSGKVLVCKQIAGKNTVSVMELPKGIYIVRIITANGTFERKLEKK
ncbi:MAG: leucine-rich repeat protein [Paludibacter sp.]|nr:leucine-rich repeat protein [Paludibacter sp.]